MLSVYMNHHLLCMQTSFEIQLVWNQVRLLVLLELVDQGGLGLWGDWGPLKFAPQHKNLNKSCFSALHVYKTCTV